MNSITGDQLRRVMSGYVTGVCIVTATSVDGPIGLTVNSFTSVSLEPPTVLVCINSSARALEGISEAGCYAVNLLSGSQAWLAQRFADPRLRFEDRFEGVDLTWGVTGSPIIRSSTGWLDCSLRTTLVSGSHHILIADVRAAAENRLHESPLAYHQRAMRPLPHEEAHRQ